MAECNGYRQPDYPRWAAGHPPRPPRRKPHKERGVSSIVEWLWNIYAQRKPVDLDFWFTTSLEPWLRLHRRKINQIRSILQRCGQDISVDDPEMKDPVIYSFRWYECYIALMFVAVRDYQKALGLNLDAEDIEELEMDGTLDLLDQNVEYTCHHVKVAIEILECLEEDFLRKHPVADIYINALNEASVFVLKIYGFGDWIGPITDSKIEGDPIGTYLSWFQQPFSVIRARDKIDYNVAAAQEGYSTYFRTRFGVTHAKLATVFEEIETAPSSSPSTVTEDIESGDSDLVEMQEVVHTETYTDKSVEESSSVLPPSCDCSVAMYYHGPPVEMYSTPQDFSSRSSEQLQPLANSWDSMEQVQYTNIVNVEQPIQPDLSNQWSYGNQYDPYMGFIWDQEYNIMS
ncbi:hypothetical protein TWF788_000375 [Orbilia oligospora]|uniref:Uncharacterized protein n=2 Tax=Orbilia oligospora TaxID=2813651 RepID=A0A7C8Q188_ORBOL|nr:hypothetical protein TWF788_000375 [Orbilia oligospora]KAF3203245.1 hypothetical protein TWF191_002669 [Orbilia oligospora]